MDKKTKLKRLQFIRALPYDELLQAHKIIERGCDQPLLSLWYNLFKMHYYGVTSLETVKATADLYIQRYPDFAADIAQWFETYISKITAAKIACGQRYCAR